MHLVFLSVENIFKFPRGGKEIERNMEEAAAAFTT